MKQRILIRGRTCIILFCLIAGITSCEDPGFAIDYYIVNDSTDDLTIVLNVKKDERERITVRTGEENLIYTRTQLGDYSEEEMLEYAMEYLQIESIQQNGQETTKSLKDIDEWIKVSNEDSELLELHLLLEDRDFK